MSKNAPLRGTIARYKNWFRFSKKVHYSVYKVSVCEMTWENYRKALRTYTRRAHKGSAGKCSRHV